MSLLDKNAFLLFVALITTSAFNDVAKTTTILTLIIQSSQALQKLRNELTPHFP